MPDDVSTCEHLDSLAQKVYARKVRSTRGRLVAFYRYKAFLGICFLPLACLLFFGGMPLWVCVLYAVYGLMMSAILFSFSARIRHSDFLSLPVAEALKAVGRLEWRRTVNMIIGFAGAAPLLAAIGIVISDIDRELLPAFWTGLLIGLVVMVVLVLKQLRMWKRLRNELSGLS